MRYLYRSFAWVLLFVATAATAGPADWPAEWRAKWPGDWSYWVGLHDYVVQDVDSHTYGVFGGLSFDRQTQRGRHLFGSVDLFADRDKDDLDPDHIPIRWDVHLGSDGKIWKGARMYVGWKVNVDTRMNTVSSVEREITALPAVVGKYEGDRVQASLKTGAGWFFLEIDDDVPKTRGYDRSDFRNSTLGYNVAADVMIRLGGCCKVDGQAQEWWDDDGWLQTQYGASIHVDVSGWKKNSELVLSADAYEYNLDVYQRPGEPTILPWDNDLLIRLFFKKAM
jgi:hypothetical protein